MTLRVVFSRLRESRDIHESVSDLRTIPKSYGALVVFDTGLGKRFTDSLNGFSETHFDLAIDIHHIFPTSYCQKQKYSRHKWNSVSNKTPLSARTNRTIGGRAPSKYISALEGGKHKLQPDRIDELISSHQITPLLIRNDDFDLFIRDRARQLLDLIGAAMGKTIGVRESEEVTRAYGGPLTIAESNADPVA